MTRDELVKQVQMLGPWHYCHVLPGGVSTGEAVAETTHPKLVELLRAGAFTQSHYNHVLDLGANSGQIAMWFADNKGAAVTAVEGNDKFFEQLKFVVEVKGYTSRIIPIKADIQRNFKYGKEIYDLVLILGVLHHLNPARYADVLRSCLKSLKPGGEIVVQTASRIPVDNLLTEVGFVNIRKLDTNWNDRAAWVGMRDPMKILTEVDQLEAVLLPDNFELGALEALGMLVLMSHWMRGIIDAAVQDGSIKLSDQKLSNWNRVIGDLELYEEFLWEMLPSRAMLPVLRQFRLTGELEQSFEKLSLKDSHGRVPYELTKEQYDDIEDVFRRIKDARQTTEVFGHGVNL